MIIGNCVWWSVAVENYTHRTCIPVGLSGLFSILSELNVVSFFFGGIGGAESNRLCKMGGKDFISGWIKLNAFTSNGSDLGAGLSPSSSSDNWFESIVELSAKGGSIDVGFGSWWNEFIELKPLSSSAELLATDLTRSFPRLMVSISLAGLYLSGIIALIRRLLVPLITGRPLFRPSRWFSSSVSVRTDDEFEWTDPSLVLLLWYELWLSRDFSLRCNDVWLVYDWRPVDFKSDNEFRWNDCNDFDSLRIGSLRFSKFCAVR